MKTLVLIVAYEAEKHITSVLDRIPWTQMPGEGQVLVMDDASSDQTSELAAAWHGPKGAWTVQVLKNPKNLGYGGNQKIGYSYAIQNGFDQVVLLHGDGQYAPELLPEMIRPLATGSASVVFGSRMLLKRSALNGGMPLYKWVANQIVTLIENKILGTTLSEFHTGYRAYRCDILRRIPFELNTNGFHFDTEIIIQISRINEKIAEIPIPTFYGNEICRVNGWKYCWGCVRSCLEAWCTDAGIFYARRFDVSSSPAGRYVSKMHLPGSSHSVAMKHVPPKSKVLDLGGGNGWVGEALVATKNCQVTILDEHITCPPKIGLTLQNYDLNRPLPPLSRADVVMLLDVLEHLDRRRQRELLGEIRTTFPSLPLLIASVPNTSFLPLRLVFLFTGRLNYGRRGILDETHRFLFSRHSLKELMSDSMFSIESLHGLPPPIGLLRLPSWIGRILEEVFQILAGLLPGLFAYQWFCLARPTPTAESLLAEARSFSP
ncbi:MAG: glycosyltransferase [Actinobacteria bacterium]|nr:glycosyltransferase [Actinomycetota bacterium]